MLVLLKVHILQNFLLELDRHSQEIMLQNLRKLIIQNHNMDHSHQYTQKSPYVEKFQLMVRV